MNCPDQRPATADLDQASPSDRWSAFCDGSAVPNPGRMGLGALLIEPDGTRHVLAQGTAGRGCNNEAEVRALLTTVQALHARGARSVLIHCDSTVVIEQVVSSTARRIPRLARMVEEARALLRSFDQASVTWIPRHRNAQADELARGSLGLARKAAVRKPGKRG